ncbi:MAG TPA: PilZ domain-containing protein [Candidatus Acidoferrales bacterium]|nr:PilZ domain-containing protein [Candidatus Acidoferrales bacterium]
MNPIPRPELSHRLRRQFTRYRFYADTEIVWESAKRWGRVTNISRKGMFIEIVDAPPLDSAFPMLLALNIPLQIDCVVRRIVPGRGIGVSISLPGQSRKRFEALLLALGAGADPAATSASVSRTVESRVAEPRVMARAAAGGKS